MRILPPITVPSAFRPVVVALCGWIVITFFTIPLAIFYMFWDFPKMTYRFFFPDRPRVIVITGANSGIGAELALTYAEPGVTLGLIARDQERLNEVVKTCQRRGAIVHGIPIDITNIEQLSSELDRYFDRFPIDLLIANAGQAGITQDKEDSKDIWRHLFEVNVFGTMTTVMTVYKKMQERGKGQIAIVSSIVGHFSMPQMMYYNATKASLLSFARDLRYLASRHNIRVSVITPGFIDTRITTDPSQPISKPWFQIFLSSPKSLAKIIQWQLYEDVFEITWPYFEFLVTYCGMILPPRILENVMWVIGRASGALTGVGDQAFT